MNLICKLIETEEELNFAHSIRQQVFVIEQNVPPEIEWDEYEGSATHIICTLNGLPVGTGRITFFEDMAKLERVAVLKPYRNSGIGRAIMEFMIELSKKRNSKMIYAHVQMLAYGFYKNLGFVEFGDKFFEADIEHIKMKLK